MVFNLVLQCIDIPIEIDPAPNWANLYMYDYEVDVISRLCKTAKPKAIKFKDAFCLIDDECDLNDSGEFSKSFHAIYLNELQLKCEHRGLHTTFLDLDVTVVNGIYE